jgi:hypothetical protein
LKVLPTQRISSILLVSHEILPIINKSKHPKKGEYKEQNGRTLSKKTKEPLQRSNHKSQGEHQVSELPHVTKNTSNKERGGPSERTPSLEESSPIARAHLKIEITYTHYNVTNILCL